MRLSLFILPALLATISRADATCACGGGSTSNGTVTGSLNIIYTSPTTNVGTSPDDQFKLLTCEQNVTFSADKPQGGSGLFSLLTDPVSGVRATTSAPLRTFVKGGTGSPLQYGTVNAALQFEASSSDVYHPVELTYEFTGELSYVGGGSDSDFREHMLVTPPAGHFLLSSTVPKQTGGGWSSYPNQVIQDPHQINQSATFLRMVFVAERGDAHHEPGDFTFPVMTQEESMTISTDPMDQTLGDVTSAFTVWLGNDVNATDQHKGRSWGRLAARPGLLSDVGAHQLRFVTAHSPVDGNPLLIDEIIGSTGRVYQIKTAAVFMDVREVVTDNRGTATNYSDDLRKVTIRLTTAADAGTLTNGVYSEPATPKYGTLRFQQTERNTDGTFRTFFRQYAPGANPDTANPIAEYEYSTTEPDAGKHRSLKTVRAGLETEVVENFMWGAGGWGSSNAVRMETRHTHIGGTTAGIVLSTSRAMFDVTTRGENLIRTESGSTSGNALANDDWAETECLEWTTHTYDTSNGTRLLTENSRGQWTEQHFSQVPFHQTVPSYYEAAVEGDRHYAIVHPFLAKNQTVAQNIATGHVAITRLSPAVCNCLSTGSTKLGVTTVAEEYHAARRVTLATTIPTTIDGTQATGRMQLTSSRRALPDNDTAALTTVAQLWPLDYLSGTDPAPPEALMRGRTITVTALPTAPAITTPRSLHVVTGQNVALSQWTAPSAGSVTTLYSKSETDPSGRTVEATTLKADITPATTTPGGTTVTTTTTAYSTDTTTPSIRRTIVSRDSLQISKEEYHPGLRKRTSTSAEGVVTETFFDALGRTTSTARTTSAGVAGTATYYYYEARTGGGTVQRVRQGTAAATIPVSEQATDNAGRTVLSKDGAGLITTTAYTVSGANTVTTETLPSGATRITTTGPDGETVSVTGTAVIAQTFENKIVGETGDTVTTPSWINTKHQAVTGAANLTGLRRRSVFTGSARADHTVTDGLGRTVAVWGGGREEYHAYDSAGRLTRIEYGPAVVSSTNTARKPLLYEYDNLDRVVKTGYSFDAATTTLDAAGDATGADRVSLTAYSLESLDGAWWQKIGRQFYATSSGDLTTATTTRERLSADVATKLLSETRSISSDGAEQRTRVTIDPGTDQNPIRERITTTTYSGVSQTAVTTHKNGVLISSTTTSVQTPVVYYYDQYGRSTGQTDPQTGRTAITEYNAQGQVDRTVDLAGNSTFYEYHATGSGAGQVKKVTHQDGAYTSFVYDAQGRVTEQTGSADYPVRYTYDATNGWMTEMKTYRDTTGNDALTGTAGNASLTTWAYDAATGLLTSKTDAASKTTSYTYWAGTTLLKERLWARFVTGTTRVTTSYDYDATGQLVSTTYNDGTPAVTRTYDRAGREATRTDAAGLTTITRTAAGFPTSEAITGTGSLTGWTLTRTLEQYGRPSGLDGTWSAAGLAANNNIVTTAYTYDGATGRLDTVTNNSRPVALTYTANSDQPYKRQFKDNANTVLFEQEYGYDEARRLNTALTRDVSPATIHAAYYYQYDNRNRRTQAIREDGIQWNYGYDARGQVTSAKMKTGADYLAGRQFEYTYDAIGNRATAKSGGTPAGTGLRTISYTRNNLNQYTAITNPQTFDVNGLDTNPNDIWVMTDPAYPYAPDSIQPATNGVTGRWRKELTAASADNSKATWETVTVKEYTIVKNSGAVRLPPVNQAPVYDADGNLTADGTWYYTWDAENRLLQMEMPALPQGTGAPPVLQRISFTYDSLSRRITKLVSSFDGTQWSSLGKWLYTWDGWNCVLRCYDDLTVINWDHGYIWGPDLSGTFQGAGGVGGLLIENKNLGSNQIARRLVGYDGNGNVTTLADGANGQLWALYEYDAFGNTTRHHNAVGTHADDNPFRFSTKPTDDETGLVYYGYRYYSSALGRWISRDPIGEKGGWNLVAICNNQAISRYDGSGLFTNVPAFSPESYPHLTKRYTSERDGETFTATLFYYNNCQNVPFQAVPARWSSPTPAEKMIELMTSPDDMVDLTRNEPIPGAARTFDRGKAAVGGTVNLFEGKWGYIGECYGNIEFFLYFDATTTSKWSNSEERKFAEGLADGNANNENYGVHLKNTETNNSKRMKSRKNEDTSVSFWETISLGTASCSGPHFGNTANVIVDTGGGLHPDPAKPGFYTTGHSTFMKIRVDVSIAPCGIIVPTVEVEQLMSGNPIKEVPGP